MEYSCFFFFFKQKTAYEMRISDWSSDVCSSDLVAVSGKGGARQPLDIGRWRYLLFAHGAVVTLLAVVLPAGMLLATSRSEEHTSELQSLMRSSYAVFCLQKKTHHTPTHLSPSHTPHTPNYQHHPLQPPPH